MNAQGMAAAALKTLEHLGYTWVGGEQWKPPIGKAPDFSLLDAKNARIAELEARLAAAPQAVQLSESRGQRVYVAGPMTGIPDYNFPAFNAAASMLRAKGWHVENPAEHGIVAGATWADYMHYDLARIATCSAIYLLPGWCQSRGAALEVHIASVLGMAFQYADGAERYHPPSATQPAAQGPMTVIDQEQWEPCSPRYLQRGGCCASAPRVWDETTKNHWHPKLPGAAEQGGHDAA